MLTYWALLVGTDKNNTIHCNKPTISHVIWFRIR
jgi:hypothetical protein